MPIWHEWRVIHTSAHLYCKHKYQNYKYGMKASRGRYQSIRENPDGASLIAFDYASVKREASLTISKAEIGIPDSEGATPGVSSVVLRSHGSDPRSCRAHEWEQE